jgi:hypothetical protein
LTLWNHQIRRAPVIRLLLTLAIGSGLLLGTALPGAANLLAKIGVGAYGGTNIPIVQDDAENGGLFGIRGRISLPIITLEPSINFLGSGDAERTIEGVPVTFEAPKVTSYAFNVLWQSGFTYGTVGIGRSSVDIPDGVGETTETTYNFGGGVEVGVGPISVDVSPRFFVINTADSASRKSVVLMIGANYYLY